jgi:hypothetical protein
MSTVLSALLRDLTRPERQLVQAVKDGVPLDLSTADGGPKPVIRAEKLRQQGANSDDWRR